VLLGWPGAQGLVCDIGGSSMELAELAGRRRGRAARHLGSRAAQADGDQGRQEGDHAHIKDRVRGWSGPFPTGPKRLFLVGGSWRAIARIDMERRGYPLRVLARIPDDAQGDPRDDPLHLQIRYRRLARPTGTSPSGCAWCRWPPRFCKALVRQFRPKEVAISAYGIREGLLYEQMSEALRHRDPLIEAARHAEATNARMPGFGRALYYFIAPLFPGCQA
jgi:exopolyphosphatase/guanosine-5'-triphosphate,3'-diphosphate pyrophosphatase